MKVVSHLSGKATRSMSTKRRRRHTPEQIAAFVRRHRDPFGQLGPEDFVLGFQVLDLQGQRRRAAQARMYMSG